MAKKKHTIEQIINKLCVELAPTTANLLLERGSTDVALLKSAQRRLSTHSSQSRRDREERERWLRVKRTPAEAGSVRLLLIWFGPSALLLPATPKAIQVRYANLL